MATTKKATAKAFEASGTVGEARKLAEPHLNKAIARLGTLVDDQDPSIALEASRLVVVISGLPNWEDILRERFGGLGGLGGFGVFGDRAG